MKIYCALLISAALCISLRLSAQDYSDKNTAERILKSALFDTISPNIIVPGSLLIKDSVLAVATAEPVLFNVYGKQHILNEKPYHVKMIGHYWIIWGSLPSGYKGGVFELVMDAENARIIKLIHGK